MKMEQIRARARNMGVKPGKLNKTALVRAIQHREGNFDCFARAANGVCDQDACLWRTSCFVTAAKTSMPQKPSTAKHKPATQESLR